ncbi:MAG: DUF732 domain-containing protein [Actinomycetota bacterium]|nr:DUF732 domain-containing protein [Actinomycetota bacterium]
MHARYVRLSSSIAAAGAAALVLGSPAAHAGEGDAQFLSTLADLGIVFATDDEAIAAGNNVCDIVAEGSANNLPATEIRSAIITAMVGEGLTDVAGTQVMDSAVATYCPEYGAVVNG